MTHHDADEVLESRLRTALADLRPAEGVPDSLRSRVDAMPREIGATNLLARMRHVVVSPGVVATAAIAASIAVLTLVVPPIVGPANFGGANAPAARPFFDPTAEGPGLVYNVVPMLVILPGFVAVVALVFAIRHLHRARWIGGWLGALRLSVLAVVVVGAAALARHPGFEWHGGGWGPILGYGVQVHPPPGSSDDAAVWYETVEPGAPLVVMMTLTNPGPLPIRLEGIVEDPLAPQSGSMRWTGMTILPDGYAITWPDEPLPAFEPQLVQPNAQVMVFLAAEAGDCVYGPTFAIDAPDVAGYGSRGRVVTFAYSVFGLASQAPFELPMVLVEPVRNRCP